jgi:hypothetical protein
MRVLEGIEVDRDTALYVLMLQRLELERYVHVLGLGSLIQRESAKGGKQKKMAQSRYEDGLLEYFLIS